MVTYHADVLQQETFSISTSRSFTAPKAILTSHEDPCRTGNSKNRSLSRNPGAGIQLFVQGRIRLGGQGPYAVALKSFSVICRGMGAKGCKHTGKGCICTGGDFSRGAPSQQSACPGHQGLLPVAAEHKGIADQCLVTVCGLCIVIFFWVPQAAASNALALALCLSDYNLGD